MHPAVHKSQTIPLQSAPLQCEYFDAPGSLRYMVLHAAADPARGRALYALHLPADGR